MFDVYLPGPYSLVFIDEGHQLELSFWYKCRSDRVEYAQNFDLSAHSVDSVCALKLTELWNTSLLLDLSYKFINENLAFNPGLIDILQQCLPLVQFVPHTFN